MLISPIIFTTVVAGNLKKVGLALGFGMVHLVRPGDGLHAWVDALDTSSLD